MAYSLFFPDTGTGGMVWFLGGVGFGVRGGPGAEVILRSLEPVRSLHLTAVGGGSGDRLTVRSSGGERAIVLKPGEVAEIPLPADPGMPYYGTFVQSLRFRSEVPNDLPGTFVALSLEVEKRARPARAAP
jgi:hypothetical protein